MNHLGIGTRARLAYAARCLRALLVIAAVFLCACGASLDRSAQVPVAIPSATAPMADVPRGDPPAHWSESEVGHVGPILDGDQLFLFHGRLGRITAAGRAEASPHRTPEPLRRIHATPDRRGKLVLIGFSRHALYRFARPFDVPQRVATANDDEWFYWAGGTPGVIEYELSGGRRGRVDLETGAALPDPDATAPRSVAFVDANHGAATFRDGTLKVSRDGGRSWTPARELFPNTREKELEFVSLVENQLVASPNGDATGWIVAPIDAAAGTIGKLDAWPRRRAAHPVLRWLREIESDSFDDAIPRGVHLSAGVALTTAGSLLARIDLATGLPLEVAELPKPVSKQGCELSRAGRSVWMLCPVESPSGSPGAPASAVWSLGVIHEPELPALQIPREVRTGQGRPQLRTSPSGGVLTTDGCAGAHDAVCVRQPSGLWVDVRLPAEAFLSAGALRDGRVAWVRGLRDGGGGSSEVVAVDAAGTVTSLSRPRPQSAPPVTPIEEAPGGQLSFIVGEADQDHEAWVVGPGPYAPPTVTVLEGAGAASIHAGRGFALGVDHAYASTDGGLTWTKLALPPALRAQLADPDNLPSMALTGGARVDVGEVGARFMEHLLVGWRGLERLRL